MKTALTFIKRNVPTTEVTGTENPYSLAAWLPILPASLTNNGHGHWAKKHKQKRQVTDLVKFAIHMYRPKKPLEKARVVLTRHSASEPDFDNLVASFKPVIDALVEAGVIIDDKSSVIGQPEYRWKKAKPKQGSIEVWVMDGEAQEKHELLEEASLQKGS